MQRWDRREFLTALAGTLLATPSLSVYGRTPSATPDRHWQTVQQLLDGYVAHKKVAGAAVALSYGDTPLSNLSAGTIALDSSTRFDENSVCRIYSMTKSVTGIAAMLLIEDGRIALDQPVAEVLPEFRSVRVAIDITKSLDSRPAVKTMTMRHLLTHTSGLCSWTPHSPGPELLHTAYRERGITPGNFGERLNRPGYAPQVKNLVEMVQRLAELPLAHEPGTASTYSVGTDVMALVIERASGKMYEAFLRDRLFGPLDMVSTGLQVRAQDVSRLTTNYEMTPDGLKPTDLAATSAFLKPPALVSGGGGLVSTARDFARFSTMLLRDGALDGVRIMKPETARIARSNLLPPGLVNETSGGYGAGGFVALPGSKQTFGSPGTFSGTSAASSFWWIDPSRRGTVVFMTQVMMGLSSATFPLPNELGAAIEADLKAGNA